MRLKRMGGRRNDTRHIQASKGKFLTLTGFWNPVRIGEKMTERPEIPANITYKEYFEQLFKDRVNKSSLSKIEMLNALIRFEITDDEDGQWNVFVENGLVRKITKGKSEKPTCTFQLDSDTFMSIVKREITPQQAFFKGKADVKGNIFLALKMNVLVEYM